MEWKIGWLLRGYPATSGHVSFLSFQGRPPSEAAPDEVALSAGHLIFRERPAVLDAEIAGALRRPVR